jgi:hypothetical protein
MSQLPAHLQGRQRPKLTELATQGLGGTMPPHISIGGNRFTLIDAAGNTAGQATLDLQVVIFDISGPHNNKRFYPPGEQWTPDSNDPPTCWSANGVTPSREAAVPQNPTCEDCRWNIRGSKISQTGASVKACRDEKWMAVYVPNAQMLFQLILTPGSFKNWKAFTKVFDGQDTDISDVIVQIGFEAGVTGVLTFQAVNYIDAATADMREKAFASKATDILVGRNDQPRALPAPLAGVPVGPAVQPALAQPAPFVPGAAPNGDFQPAPFVPGSIPSGGMPQAGQTASAPSAGNIPTGATATSPSNGAAAIPGAPPARRKRRTAAEMAAANAAAQGAPVAQTEAPRQAPFPNPGQTPAFAPAPAPATGPQFGIGGGMAPNAEVTAALSSIFPTK